MPITLGSFLVTETGWINVSTLTNIPTGTALVIQNQSASQFFLAISDTKPTDDFRGLVIPAEINITSTVSAGEPDVWIKGKGRINIQEG